MHRLTSHKLLLPLYFCLFVFLAIGPTSRAQTDPVSKEKWRQQMRNEEFRISAYIDEQMKQTERNNSLVKSLETTISSEKLSEAQAAEFSTIYLRNYYRNEYLQAHPEVKAIFNPAQPEASNAVASASNGRTRAEDPYPIRCEDGNFEDGPADLAAYDFYQSSSYVNVLFGGCGFIPFAIAPAFTNIGYISPDFLLTNSVPDPIIPSINQTHNGSNHAMRINNFTSCSFITNMLQKTFTAPSTGKAKISFAYAMILQSTHLAQGFNNDGFFVARVLDNSGTEVGTRICLDATTPGLNSTTTARCDLQGNSLTLYKDWTCETIEFDADAGKSYTIEFFVSGCAGLRHYGYAYVDDICAEMPCCPLPPTKVRCESVPGGSYISWSPVPGVANYEVIIHNRDPFCCEAGTPEFMANWVVSGTNVIVPYSFSSCFSFSVNSICDNGETIQSLEKHCSCTPPCQSPSDQECYGQNSIGNILSWSPVSGAAYYQLVIYHRDPLCCLKGNGSWPPFMAVINTTSTNYVIYTSFSDCFSWYVTTVCTDSTRSQPPFPQCSCNAVPRPGISGNDFGIALPTPLTNDRAAVLVSPNPGSEYIDFLLQSMSGPVSNAKLMLHIYDVSGKEMTSVPVTYNKNHQVDVRSYPAGTYIYRFIDAGRRIAEGKVVVIRK